MKYLTYLNRDFLRTACSVVFFTLWAVLCKCAPHAVNFHPQLVIMLCLGSVFSKQWLIFSTLLTMILPDLAFYYISDYSAFGYWTFFTYSIYMVISFSAHLMGLSVSSWKFIPRAFLAGLFFWLWTNFGVWLLSGMYDPTLAGFFKCYLLAWPFLENTLLSTISWGVLVVIIAKIRKYLSCCNFTSYAV